MNETMSGIILLYHTGFREIREPDVHFGRKNADFGQGFYMTAEKEFASRWATEQKGASAWQLYICKLFLKKKKTFYKLS